MRIGKKLFLALLGLSLAALALSTANGLIQLQQVRDDVGSQQNEQMGQLAQSNIEVIMEADRDMVTALAGTYSKTIDSKFGAITKQVEMIRDYLQRDYANGQSTTSRFPDDMYYLQPGVDYWDVELEFHCIKGVRDIIDSTMQADPDIAVYYVSQSGLLLADRYVDYDSGSGIDRRTRPWYLGAVENNDIFWTPMYMDALSGEMTITCSAPVFAEDGTVLGVIASDILIGPLINSILATNSDIIEYTFLMDEDDFEFVGSIDDKNLSDFMSEEAIRRLTSAMLANSREVGLLEDEEVMVGYAPIAATDWRLGVVLNYQKIIAPATRVVDSIATSNNVFHVYLNGKIRTAIVASALVAGVMLALVLVISRLVTRTITRPLALLTAGVEQISGGSLDQRIELTSGDECEQLAKAFNQMSRKLSDYVENLAVVTAERERIATELDLAKRIQSSMLPSIFPAFPDRTDIDIYATMNPAKEGGGDFYDFFLIDETRLGIVIADVSGKGVPAALFMVIAKTLLKNVAQQGMRPKDAMYAVNNQLMQGNDESMFVTAFFGVLDITTGTLTYTNAGHLPPYIVRTSGPVEPVHVEQDLILAVFENNPYEECSLTLQPGDRLFLYTDGVTEAMNPQDELFGEMRLEETLAESTDRPLREMLQTIFDTVRRFEDGADPADDITMVALRLL